MHEMHDLLPFKRSLSKLSLNYKLTAVTLRCNQGMIYDVQNSYLKNNTVLYCKK